MTDKEINNKCDGAICPHYRQCVLLQHKTEECKRLKYDNDYQVGALEMTIDKLKAECEKLREANDEKNEFLQKLGISATGEFHRIKHYIDKLHQECEELKKKVEDYKHDRFCQGGCAVYQYDKIHKLKQALEKIEEILKYYANSTLGELQPNGTYRYLLNQSPITGEQYLYFNPLKAQEGLKIIDEVKE